jgi:quercetin dioxygenase-like cupin family protein
MKAEDIKGRAMALAGMVEYHTGSVVSRTVIDNPSGSITLFAFEKGEGLSEHTAPFDAALYLIEGDADVTISGKSQPVTAGDLIILPAHSPHALRALTRFKMLLVMIKS